MPRMARWLMILGLALALALPIALLACGSDEPSVFSTADWSTPAPAAERVRSTAKPGPAAVPAPLLTPTITPTPTATPLPTATHLPRATRTLSSWETIRITELRALAAIYDALGGRNWINANWGNAPSIGERIGVTTGLYGQVVELDLSGNGLRGNTSGGE